MAPEDHEQLLEKLLQVKGMVLLSGYRSEMYDDMLKDWRMITFPSRASSKAGTVIREECVWISPAAEQPNLFNIS
ncbi:hypothetical protein ACM66T_10000 [Sulfurimonas sp. ST-25]|uniref:hypothetical protein n=1 Tax=Sulfurimonas sp. ST-25 TaxID=3400151 RepID=UPI003A86A3DD